MCVYFYCSWECNDCGLQGESGGPEAEAAHKVSVHMLDDSSSVLTDVKKEDTSDGFVFTFLILLLYYPHKGKIEFSNINP